jgi:hypothetical protein
MNGHHFLYYIFKADKAANPMPADRAETLLNKLKRIFKNKETRKEGN